MILYNIRMISNEDLVERARSVIHARQSGTGHTIGNVGAALITDKGNVYCGVCIDVGSGIGFCAEHNAIGSMITAGESRIRKIVAVRKDEENKTSILSPCGRCREFMRQIDGENLEADVVLRKDKTMKLKDLLPYHDWSHQF
jgi:cytidine deaminase